MSSLFRRSFSRRIPDRVLEISERIYVFDSCFANTVMSENEFKTYLGVVVKSLHRFHPGASFMVFNFQEGEQTSMLADILIDYDMTVVDYPRHHEGYPLLPLEMIHYFVRSSESWLTLEGQKNVILMHCEKGGWPVLAFMLAGLLLYRKQYTGEQKTLEMVFKQAPKDVFSVLSPINPRGSQLRYLKYITGRDLASDWPPSDAPLVVDYLLLRNLPLFDNGKGCRPVVRVYGQDPTGKGNRSPKLLFSSLMAEHIWLYPKEECIFVKLEICCQVLGDVFLECIHLYDDLASEDMIFKVMFHTGFIQSNLLALNSDEVDVSWNTKYKLPKDFKAEVLFRDINEVPVHIAMELGGAEESHDSDGEFFEADEIFNPTPESQERKIDSEAITDQEVSLINSKNKDCTLHNGAPRWDLETEVTDVNSFKSIAVGEREIKQEEEPFIKDIVVTDLSLGNEKSIDVGMHIIETEAKADKGANLHASTVKFSISAAKDVVVDDEKIHKLPEALSELPAPYSVSVDESSIVNAQKNIPLINERFHMKTSDTTETPEPASVADSVICAAKSIVLDEDRNHRQASETESKSSVITTKPDPVISTSEKIVLSDNKNHKQASETMSGIRVPAAAADYIISAPKNILLVEDRDHKQPLETKSEIITIIQASGEDPIINPSKNSVRVEDMNLKQALEINTEMSDPASVVQSGIIASKKSVTFADQNQEQTLVTISEVRVPASEESVIIAPPNIVVVEDRNNKEASEAKTEISIPAYGVESSISAPERIVPTVDRNTNHASEKSEISEPAYGVQSGLSDQKDIVQAEDRNHKQFSEKLSEITVQASAAESGIIATMKKEVTEDRNYEKVSETESVISASKNTAVVLVEISIPAYGGESSIGTPERIALMVERNTNQASDTKSEISIPAHEVQSGLSAQKDIVQAEDKNHKQFSEKISEITIPASAAESGISASKNKEVIEDRNYVKASDTESVITSKNTAVADDWTHKQASKIGSETSTLKNIVVVNDGSQIQDVKVEFEPKPVPISIKTKQIKKNKWQEMAAKTITQQKVIAQWVPRNKVPAPETTKPKPPAYKWVPKGAAPSTDNK